MPEQTDDYDWPALRRFWREHSERLGTVDLERDPDGLNNVCQSGAPLAVNRYYQRGQRRVFRHLLERVTPPRPGSRALDVGCGTGRWSAQLDRHGYDVTGIDLQPSVIELNRRRFPRVRFECQPIQDFHDGAERGFDLITSITVLQHLPEAEQVRAVERIAAMVADEGHVLILENVSDRRRPHMFARLADGWVGLFRDAGLTMVARRSYDYSPALRLYYLLTARWRRLVVSPFEPRTDRRTTTRTGGTAEKLRTLDRALRVAACRLDHLTEPALVALQVPIPTVHQAMLFEKSRT